MASLRRGKSSDDIVADVKVLSPSCPTLRAAAGANAVDAEQPFANLVVTDVSFPGGEQGPANRQWLRSKGAQVVMNPVNCYDYLYDINRTGLYLNKVDIVLVFGMCYGQFNSCATSLVSARPSVSPFTSSVRRQYDWLPNDPLHHLNEALMGQNIATTNIIVAPQNYVRNIRPVADSYPTLQARVTVPPQLVLSVRMRHSLSTWCPHLLAHVSGPGVGMTCSHLITTASGGVQLDFCSLLLCSKRHGSIVVSLASGEARIFELMKANTIVPEGLPVVAPVGLGEWTKDVVHPQFGHNRYRGYFEHCLTQPWGSAPGNTLARTATGRLNLVSVAEWTRCGKLRYRQVHAIS